MANASLSAEMRSDSGKGVARKGRPAGDLYVHLAIRIPRDDAAADAIHELEKHMVGDVRAGIAL